jgi:hypothetical protein
VVDAVRARDHDRAVGRAVVDRSSHSTESKPGTSRGRSRRVTGSVCLLVEAGDLDDELHGPTAQSTIGAVKSRLRDEAPALAVLGLILVAGGLLRVLNNDHGLPYVYYVDEGSHFTKRAVEVFRDANPGYFQNPSPTPTPPSALPRGGDPDRRRAGGHRRLPVQLRVDLRALARAGGGALPGRGGGRLRVGRQLWDRPDRASWPRPVLCFAFLPVAFSRSR